MRNRTKRTRTIWRLEEGSHSVFSADVWRKEPLPVVVWCARCAQVTDQVEVPCKLDHIGTPIEVGGICTGEKCEKRVLVATVTFCKPSHYHPASKEPSDWVLALRSLRDTALWTLTFIISIVSMLLFSNGEDNILKDMLNLRKMNGGK